MLDIATAFNKYGFLGNDFLTWIWFQIETDADNIIYDPSASRGERPQGQRLVLEMGNTMKLEIPKGDKATEKITIKGDQAGLEEAKIALKKGGKVTEMNLIIKLSEEEEYSLTFRGQSFNITSLKCPAVGRVEAEDEVEGAVLEKAYFVERVTRILQDMFRYFVVARINPDADLELDMRMWIWGEK